MFIKKKKSLNIEISQYLTVFWTKLKDRLIRVVTPKKNEIPPISKLFTFNLLQYEAKKLYPILCTKNIWKPYTKVF